MSDDARGDDVYQPTGDDSQNPPTDDLDLENVLDERDLDDQMEEGYSPPEKPLGVEKYGTTGAEEREGESLDQRLAQETPDVEPVPGDGIGDLTDGDGEPEDDVVSDGPRAGRLAQDRSEPGRANDVVAHDVGIDGGAASAEEAAVHLVEDDGTGT
ncbi:DUF5709 domain-containing protein [uncultured Streptomyces sp.]|uniref:DUF5709 domain-containing protein n=1 Tax=uncultured Streptomyces sp. TaxID=174707 RepID=UPI00260727F4|nr:DUF5709 domain-containing protein [uncultured Streptomyces sp.]